MIRGRVCNVQLMLDLTKAVFLESEFRGTHDQIWYFPQPARPSPGIYITQEQCGPVIPPDTGGVTLHSLRKHITSPLHSPTG
jgi:hypothetical protein